jgi:hypothetical protein
MTLTGVGDPFSYSDNPCVSNANHVFSVAPLLENYCLSPVVRIASRIEAVNILDIHFGEGFNEIGCGENKLQNTRLT